MKKLKLIYTLLILLYCLPLSAKDEIYTLSNNAQIVLRTPDSNVLEQLPGPHHYKSGCNCLMCVGNHLLGNHNVSYEYMTKIGYSQWYTLHNNLHNDSSFSGHVNRSMYAYGYNTPFPSYGPIPIPPSVFAPTPVEVIDIALRTAKLTKDDILYDLGCGDGRALLIATKLFGCRTVGIDIDKNCVEQANINVKLNKLSDMIRIYELDITNVNIEQATVAFVYLQPELSKKLKYLKDIPQVIAHDKPIPGLTPVSMLKIKNSTIYFWKKPSTTNYL